MLNTFMEMQFREWLLLEMPHLRVKQCPMGGECFIDLHAEKWNIDNGESLGSDWKWRSFKRNDPWIGPWGDGWIVFDGGQGAYYSKEKPEGNYQELPPGWYEYAEVIDEKGLQVKKPKFNIEDFIQ